MFFFVLVKVFFCVLFFMFSLYRTKGGRNLYALYIWDTLVSVVFFCKRDGYACKIAGIRRLFFSRIEKKKCLSRVLKKNVFFTY